MTSRTSKAAGESFAAFLSAIKDDHIRSDARVVARLMQQATKAKPKLWGAGIVGFGTRVLRYAGGRQADWMLIGFAPRETNLTLYVGRRFENRGRLLKALGKHRMSGGCLHIKRVSDVHLPTLKKIVVASVKRAKKAG